MERFKFTLILLLIWNIHPAYADVLLAEPEAPAPPKADESYPSSRFGAPPMKPDLGIGPEFTSQALDDLHQNGLNGKPTADRRPAGLEFSSETGQTESSPIIPGKDMPQSLSNANPKPSSIVRNGVQEIALIAGDLGFFPKTVFVTQDIPVRLFVTGASKKPLCIMMDSFRVRKQIRSQKVEEINFVPKSSGQYRFYCPVNGTEGTLLVKEINSVLTDLNGPKPAGE